MALKKELLEILVCPKCRGELEYRDNVLICHNCRLVYPVIDDIPVLLIDRAIPLEEWEREK